MQADPEVDLPAVGGGYLNESALGELKQHLVLQETKVAEMRERYREDAPELVAALSTLQSMKDILKREVSARIKMTQSRLSGLEDRVAVLDRELNRVRADLATMPTKEMNLTEIDREIDVLRTRYKDLIENSDKAKINEQTSRSIFVIVLTPASAAHAQNTRDYVRLALAPAFSLVVGVGLAFFIDGLDNRMRTPGQAEESLEMPVLASIRERRRKSG
jgi:uncharacterized protein involved in exopolysaccharide biosynthesis